MGGLRVGDRLRYRSDGGEVGHVSDALGPVTAGMPVANVPFDDGEAPLGIGHGIAEAIPAAGAEIVEPYHFGAAREQCRDQVTADQAAGPVTSQRSRSAPPVTLASRRAGPRRIVSIRRLKNGRPRGEREVWWRSSSTRTPPGSTTRICPPGRWPGLALGETWRLRSVCFVLAQRVLKVRYRHAAVGISWALIQPMLLMIAFTIFLGIIARLPSEGLPYPLFFYTGLVLWQVTAKLLGEGSNSILANAMLVRRIYFPRIYFPAAVGLSTLVDLAFTSVALVLLMAWYGFVPGLTLLALPLILVLTYAASLGLVFFFAALNVSFRDVAVLLPFITQVGFFVSPIIYPASLVPAEYHALYFMNPFALGIEAFRWALLGTPMPGPEAWLAGTTVAVLLLVGGYVFFRRREPTFADML